MEKDIPKVYYAENQHLQIEVMSFPELYKKLEESKNHDPFTIHKIEFYLILILHKNSYTHFVDFKSYQLNVGDAIFIAKNQVQRFTKLLQKADGVCIVFNSFFVAKNQFLSSQNKLNRLFNYHIETPVISKQDLGKDSFLGISQKLYEEYIFQNDFAKSEILHALLHVLFLKAERAKEFKSVKGIKLYWLETFNKFKNLLEKKYTKTRNSREYASMLNISYKLLNDIVKKLTGKTVKGFIDDFVTIEIKRHLVSSSLSVKEISYKIGFDEPSNMVKFFKKNTQTTPLKFKQLN